MIYKRIISSLSYKINNLYLKKNIREKYNNPNGLINAAIIGCGGSGLMHASHYLTHDKVIVKKIFDINKKRFDDVAIYLPYADSYIEKTSSFDSILKDDTIELISVCTPDFTHANYVVKALEAGKNVLVEKPMATNIKDCYDIIEADNKSSSKLSVFHQMRFVARNQKIKQLVGNNDFGEIFFLESGYVHNMRDRYTLNDDWRLNIKFEPILGSCHHIDILRWLMGEVESVYTMGNNVAKSGINKNDNLITNIKFKNSAIATVLTLLGPCLNKEIHPLNIYGTKATLIDNNYCKEDNGLIIEESFSYEGYTGYLNFKDQVHQFVDCVIHDRPVSVSSENGAKTVMVCLAAIESLEKNKSIDVISL